jgi:hypothetical protein
VDNDNKGDFLLSSPLGTGNVYLFRGSSLTAWGQDTPPSAANTHIVGAYASTGDAVAGLGDVNGDPYDDFAIGAPDYGAGYGKAYAVLGRSAGNWPSELDIESAEGGWQGVGHKDWAGRDVTGGDLNDDGLADLIIGVDGSPFAGFEAGLVYVVPSDYGADDIPPTMVTGFQAQVDLADSIATLSWNTVTVDENGGPEQVLFYRALRYRYPSSALHAQLPAILHPQHAAVDTGWVPWFNEGVIDTLDATAPYDSLRQKVEYDYYRLLAIDETGNASDLTPWMSIFDVDTNIP